jgi:hypothetical protein
MCDVALNVVEICRNDVDGGNAAGVLPLRHELADRLGIEIGEAAVDYDRPRAGVSPLQAEALFNFCGSRCL